MQLKTLVAGSLLLASLSLSAQTQRRIAHADPRLGQIVLISPGGQQLNADALVPGQVVRLRIPVSNSDDAKALPAGTTKLKIGFGSKLQLDPSFDMNAAGLTNYFRWTAEDAGGQLQVTGELIADMPRDLQHITVTFKVKTAGIGKSTITANFLVTNHNPAAVLSDMDPTNNASFLPYTISAKAATVPVVKITDVAKGACTVNLVFGSSKEESLSRYDVEVSSDGSNYVKLTEVAATGRDLYQAAFAITAAIEAQTILVRVRSVDMNGNYIYSEPVSVKGMCEKAQPWTLSVYPNPAHNVRSVVISATQGEFKGKYKVSMIDVTGQVVQTKAVQLDQVKSFTYDFGVIAAGMYLIQVQNADGSQSNTLKLEKL